jgi:hypothetical protein
LGTTSSLNVENTSDCDYVRAAQTCMLPVILHGVLSQDSKQVIFHPYTDGSLIRFDV